MGFFTASWYKGPPVRLIIAAAGRWKTGPKSGGKAAPERALFDHFAGRIRFPLELKEIEEKKKLKPAALKRREAELLLLRPPFGSASMPPNSDSLVRLGTAL